MERAVKKYGIQLADRQLACAPFDSNEAQAYLGAMRAAANYAWANASASPIGLARSFRESSRSLTRSGALVVYDVAHNIAKLEEHQIDGRIHAARVHRKGATRAFPPDTQSFPKATGPLASGPRPRRHGAGVVRPGGDSGRHERDLRSTCHGAGRLLSRAAAIRAGKGRSIERETGRHVRRVRQGERTRFHEEEMPRRTRTSKMWSASVTRGYLQDSGKAPAPRVHQGSGAAGRAAVGSRQRTKDGGECRVPSL